MAALAVPERRRYWESFDRRYHLHHPELRPMRRNVWELPHWMTWMGGVLEAAGYRNLGVLDLYTVECDINRLDAEAVTRLLRDCPADVYLFSPMIPNLHFAYQIADLAKLLYPGSLCVFGGVVATPLPEELAVHPSVDFVVHGRGEYALVSLLNEIGSGSHFDTVGNLCFRDAHGEPRRTGSSYPWMLPAQLPFPKVDLFPRDTGLDLRYLRIVHGLGCPYKCGMCTIQTIGHKVNYFPLERVIAEINAYREYYGRHHNIYFGDETFTVSRIATTELCEALAAEGGIHYDCQTRINLLKDPDMLRAMQRSGCRWVEVGIEATDQGTQNIFKQRVPIRTLRETLGRVRDSGLATCSFLVNGFPNQTLDEMRRSIDDVCELIAADLLTASYLFGLVPYPGSDLYAKPEKYGVQLHHHRFNAYHEDMPPVYDTQLAGSEDIHRVFLEGLVSLSEAMGAPSPDSGESRAYGAFWEGAHV